MTRSFVVTVLAGAAGEDQHGEIGGNKILVSTSDRTWILDFGTRFSQTGRYFDEFLQPRVAVGLRDFLRMGLVPPLEGLLRDDLTLHEPDLWQRYRNHPDYRRIEHIDGILLSHAHQDHNGALGFVRRDVPVYTGLMTALICKGMQDIAAGSGPHESYSYLSPRELGDNGTLRTTTGLKQARQHIICEKEFPNPDALDKVRSFLSDHPGKRTTFEPASIECEDLEACGIKFWRVDHSIPGSGAFAINTPIGWIGYTGDLRLHGHSGHRTRKFATELAELKPELLIVEGTNLADSEATKEPDVHAAAEAVVRAETGLVVADFSPRNIERLRTFRDIAKSVGRRLIVTVKDAYLLEQMHLVDPKIPCPDEEPLGILRAPRATTQSWEAPLNERFSHVMVDAKTIRANPAGYIMCLSFWDIANLIDIEPTHGVYIYSSSEAHNEEQRVDQIRLTEWLNAFNLKAVGGLPGAEQGPFHASGHIDGPGMEWLIETIASKRILPVHSQKLAWFTKRWPDKVVRAERGQSVRFD
jgi:ribonuclease J